MTDNPDLHCGRGWLARASDVLTGAEEYLSAVEYAHIAAVIGNGYVNLAHTTRALEAMGQASEVATRQLVAFDAIADAADRTGDPTLEAAATRVAQEQAEARPHDAEAALDVAARLPARDPAHPFPYISEMAGARPHDDEPSIVYVIEGEETGVLHVAATEELAKAWIADADHGSYLAITATEVSRG